MGKIFNSLAEAGKHAGLVRQAIYIAIKKGYLKAIKKEKGWEIDEADLQDYLVNRYNREAKKETSDGKKVFDFDQGTFSVLGASKFLSQHFEGGCDKQRVYYLIRCGVIPAHRIGAAYVIKKEDLEAYVLKVLNHEYPYPEQKGNFA